jgi:SAM-dependent methyltransferase
MQGCQRLEPEHRGEALSYYHRTGPIGAVLTRLEARDPPPPVAVIGLGVGTLASYGRQGQEVTFYEIDPAVIRIARDPALFSYLTDAEARGVKVNVLAGDGRLQLARAADGHFGLIVIDAFNGDAVPTHLLTREAVALYVCKLAPGGVVAFHVSNRWVKLAPVLGDVATHMGLVGQSWYDTDNDAPGKVASDWVLLARRDADLDAVADGHKWKPLAGAGGRMWTDDYSNVFDALRRREAPTIRDD